MKSLVIDSIPEGTVSNYYIHKSGSIIFRPGQKVTPDKKKALSKAGIESLTYLSATDNLQDFIHSCKNTRQNVDTLQIGQKITQSVYDRKGTLLLESGSIISDGLTVTFKSRGIDYIFIKKDNAELDYLKIKQYEDICKSKLVDNEAVDSLKTLDATVSKERLFSNTGLLTPSFLDKGVIEDIVCDGQSLSTIQRKLSGDVFRSDEDKCNFLDIRKTTSAEMKKIFFHFRVGTPVRGEIVSKVANTLMGAMLYDQNLCLNLTRDTVVDTKDWIANHSFNVAILSMNIAMGMGYSKEQILELSYGAFMHNVGMYKINDKVLYKPSALTSSERLEIQRHSIYGINALQKVDGLPLSTPYVAYQIHERENGKGYPKARRGSFIHPFAKIVAVADTYEALVENRPYRKGVLPYMAMESVVRLGARGYFNRDVIKALLGYMSLFPVGSWVELNNNCLAKVVAANGGDYTKPVLSVVFENRQKVKRPFRIDMSQENDVKIIQSFDGSSLEKNIMEGF